MSFKINQIINDGGDRGPTLGEKFKTPRLPPVEELALLKFWKVMLEFNDLEDEVATSRGIPIWEVVNEKMIEKECPNLTLASTLRIQLGLDAPSSRTLVSETRPVAKAKPSKSSFSSSTSKTDSLASRTGRQKFNYYRTVYWLETRDFHPDEILLRFLVQQDWDIGKAFERILLTAIFRAKWDTDGLLRSGEEGALKTLKESKDKKERETASGFLRQCRVGKTLIHGRDFEGRPVVITRLRFNNSAEENVESVNKFILWQIECGRLMLGPSATDTVSIWDFSGVGADNVHLQSTKFLLDVFQKYFPGAFSILILHNCPKFFEKSWDVIRGWLHPKGESKVKFTRSVSELEQYIPRDNIIEELGGDDPWEFSYIPPHLGENDLMKNSELEQSVWDEHEGLWNICDNYTRTMIDMASKGIDYTEVKRRRNDLATYMRVSYWKLDPFIRARSYYDRSGDIGFRRESAFMALILTHGKDIDYNTARLDEIAPRGSSTQPRPGSLSDIEDEIQGHDPDVDTSDP